MPTSLQKRAITMIFIHIDLLLVILMRPVFPTRAVCVLVHILRYAVRKKSFIQLYPFAIICMPNFEKENPMIGDQNWCCEVLFFKFDSGFVLFDN